MLVPMQPYLTLRFFFSLFISPSTALKEERRKKKKPRNIQLTQRQNEPLLLFLIYALIPFLFAWSPLELSSFIYKAFYLSEQ